MKGVVLAAGKGVRLRPLTEKKPKALVELNGKPLIEHVLEALQKAGIKETGIVTGYLHEAIEKKLGKDFNGMPLSFLGQGEQLGTANAVAIAENFVAGEKFVCTYTDVIAGSDIFVKAVDAIGGKKKSVFLEAADGGEDFDAIVVGRQVEDPWRFGVLKFAGNRLVDIVEKPLIGQEPSKIINAGVYAFTPKIFDAIRETGKSVRGEFEITGSIKILVAKGKVGFVLYEGMCIDISGKEDLEQAEKILKGRGP